MKLDVSPSIRKTFTPIAFTTDSTPPEYRRLAVEIYRSGLRICDVGYLFGVHPATVSKWSRQF